MEEINSYRTVKHLSEGLYKEKGSKFISFAVACFSEDEAKSYLTQWRKEHHQARHLCYAYRLGLDKQKYRVNDDGEPGNSAGAPILGQIQAYDLTNILIGVVRYFGGTKLGVGGLINAYRSAAKDALEQAVIIEVEVFHRIQLDFTYEQMNDLMPILKKYELEMSNVNFEESCSLTTAVPLAKYDVLFEEISSLRGVVITEKGIH